MRIGYLHLGSPEHGITRYGRMLAAEAKNHSDLTVVEAEVVLTGDIQRDRAAIVEAAQQLSHLDVVHFQYNRSIWGENWYQLRTLNLFLRHCLSPLVVTLHDIFYPRASRTLLQSYWQRKQPINLTELFRATMRDAIAPNILALRKVVNHARIAFVCTQEEARRLSDRIPLEKVRTIPHFVESRHIQTMPTEARQALKLEGYKVITLLGFIFGGKGHHLLIEALTQLPQDFFVVFAGGASKGHEAFCHTLEEFAEAQGVSDRLRITGYLSEQDLEQYLIATDLAVCPFQKASASGSLSTWISVERPILASNIAQVAEHNHLQPGAIQVFSPYTAHALADRIKASLDSSRLDRDTQAISQLRQQLALPAVFQQHLSSYAEISATCHS